MEVLNNSIRKEEEVDGIRMKDQDYKLLAFTDDLVVILENPTECYESLQKIIEKYGERAGMKMNLFETKMITKNMNEGQEIQLKQISGIEIGKNIKYLGLALSDFQTYFKAAKVTWLREGILLRNKRLLFLESHDLDKVGIITSGTIR